MHELSRRISRHNSDTIYCSNDSYKVNGVEIDLSKINEISLLEILRHRLYEMKKAGLATTEINKILEKVEEAIMWSDLYLSNNNEEMYD